MANVQEQQAMTAFKKMMNTLNEVGQLSAAEEGYDYTSASSFGTRDDSALKGQYTLLAIFNDRAQMDTKNSGQAFPGGNNNKCSSNNNVVLRDGTAICFTGNYNNNQPVVAYIDTNGYKAPNSLSTCTNEGCTSKSGKDLKDQYRVTLYKSQAIPGGWTLDGKDQDNNESYAARYAMGSTKRKGSGS